MYEIITLSRTCERLQALPGPGGVLDQDSYIMYLMNEVFKADQERQELDAKRRQ